MYDDEFDPEKLEKMRLWLLKDSTSLMVFFMLLGFGGLFFDEPAMTVACAMVCILLALAGIFLHKTSDLGKKL